MRLHLRVLGRLLLRCLRPVRVLRRGWGHCELHWVLWQPGSFWLLVRFDLRKLRRLLHGRVREVRLLWVVTPRTRQAVEFSLPV